MSPGEFERLGIQVQSLIEDGKHSEALDLLKRAVAETDTATYRLVATSEILTLYLSQVIDNYATPGTKGYAEVQKYLEIFLEAYDLTEPEYREELVPDIDIGFFRYLHELAGQGRPLEVTTSQEDEKMAESQTLVNQGRFKEAIEVLKDLVKNAKSEHTRMFAAGLIVSIDSMNIPGTPSPGSPRYLEIRKYLKFAIDSYERATPFEQQKYRDAKNDPEMQRALLELMERGEHLDEGTKNSGCFIATAAYGSSMTNEVRIFRDFRDDILRNSKQGRILLRLYYSVSPHLAGFIENSRWLAFVTRRLFLTPILWLLTIFWSPSKDNKKRIRR